MSDTNRHRNLIIRKFVIVIILLGMFAIFTSILRYVVTYYEVKNSFCTGDDQIYQTIYLNVISWAENTFHPNLSSSRNYIEFSTSNGQKYTAIGLEPDQFFVVTEYDYPHTKMGLKGYLYSPNIMTQFLSEYDFVALGDNLYCYEQKL